jgi:hypothetical protein
VRASNIANAIFFTESSPPGVGWFRSNTHIHDMDGVNVALWSVADRSHTSLYHPWICGDVPDCSVEFFKQITLIYRKQKAGLCGPAFCLFRSFRLLPVPFHHHPATIALLIMMSDPYRAGMRRTNPAPVNPNVTVTVPAVIAVVPHPTRTRGMIVDLNNGRGRRNPNHYLRHQGCRSKSDRKKKCKNSFLHGESRPPWSDSYRNRGRFRVNRINSCVQE